MSTKRIDFYAKPVLLIVDRNPKKPGSQAHERFRNYFDLKEGATVADALKAGIRMDDIRHDSEHGFIAVGQEMIDRVKEDQVKDRERAIEAAKALLAEVEAEEKEEEEA